MKTTLRLVQLLSCLSFLPLLAWAAEAPVPVRRQGPVPVRSPEILADRQVTFRLRAAQAREVAVSGQFGPGRSVMVKDTNDVWSVTVGPVEPGVYEYSFNVDGLSMIDPGNPAIKPMREPRTSILHVPGEPPRLVDFQDVPHGAVHKHTYRSKPLGRIRELEVYTPPDYARQADQRFPALYLQHGSGDNQSTWTVHGKAHWMADNLLAQGRIKPMVIVMLDGHAAVPGGAPGAGSNTEAFEKDLLLEAMPLVEAAYRVRQDAAGRGIVGLSMGGGQSLTIGMNHTELFAWVGGFSSAVPQAEGISAALADVGGLNGKLKLLWIGCGEKDFLLERNKAFIDMLKDKGVRHTWVLTEGDHSWPVWRRYLADFLPLLFQ